MVDTPEIKLKNKVAENCSRGRVGRRLVENECFMSQMSQ